MESWGENADPCQTRCRAGVAACHGVSGYVAQKSRASRFSVAGRRGVSQGVARVMCSRVILSFFLDVRALFKKVTTRLLATYSLTPG